MNPQRLKQIFPHASQETININADRLVSDSGVEQDQKAALGRAKERKTEGMGGTRIRFTGYRVRPLDPDNFAGSVKDLLDGLRHAGVIEGDEWWRITLETTQKQVEHYNQERTLIEITYSSSGLGNDKW
jgi:hypothetical protein